EPESHDLRRTVFADEHGMRAQVAMNDPVAMRVRKTACNAFDDGPSLVVLESFAADLANESAQPAAAQRFHDEEDLVLVLIDVVDRNDVRMDEGLRTPHCGFEGGVGERLVAQVYRDDLHGHVEVAFLRHVEIERSEDLSDAYQTERREHA